MKNAKIEILNANIEVLRIIHEMIINKDQDIFTEDIKDAVLLCLCSIKAISNNIKKNQNEIHNQN